MATTLEFTVEMEGGGWANLVYEGRHYLRTYGIGHKLQFTNGVLGEVTDVWHSVRLASKSRKIGDPIPVPKPSVVWLKTVEPISQVEYDGLLEMGFTAA